MDDDFGGPSIPDPPPAPAIPEPPNPDAAELARLRKQRQANRFGRDAARIDDPATNTGMGGGTGIRIPTGGSAW